MSASEAEFDLYFTALDTNFVFAPPPCGVCGRVTATYQGKTCGPCRRWGTNCRKEHLAWLELVAQPANAPAIDYDAAVLKLTGAQKAVSAYVASRAEGFYLANPTFCGIYPSI